MLVYYLNLVDSPEEKNKVETIYHKYKKLIKHLALSKLHNEHLAEDVLHEVMLAVIEQIKKLQDRDENGIKCFIYLVTRNICIDLLRKETRQKEENYDRPPVQFKNDGDPQICLNERFLLDCIAELSPIYRDILELTAYYGLTIKECARTLKITPTAAQKRLERARTMIRAKLEEEEIHV
jgi:RNA polymerase sigma-70 factor (ECF subfamily)